MKPKSCFSHKQILLYITYAVALYLGLTHFSTLQSLLTWFIGMLQPVLFGFVIAFILNLFMGMFRRKIFCRLERSKHKLLRKLCTPLCVLCTVLCVIGFILLIVFLIIPQVTTAVSTLIEKIPQSSVQFKEMLIDKLTKWHIPESIIVQVEAFVLDWDKLLDFVINVLDGKMQSLVDGAVTATTSVISTATNFVLGIIIAIYILAKKERFMFFVRSIIELVLPERYHDRGFRILHLAKRSCANFITGQLIEAVIIGVLCTAGLALLKFPFAAAIGVLIGITALIPIIGAWIGGGVGVLLVWVDSPDRTLWFLVFILMLQLLEGQFIYPKVVGDSLGLPGLVVLVAVILGTSFGGVAGIFVAVPLSAILYTLLKETIEAKHAKRADGEENDEPKKQSLPEDESIDTLVEEIVGLPTVPVVTDEDAAPDTKHDET